MDDSLSRFFETYDDAMRDYEKGYVDADATLERITQAAETLREREAGTETDSDG